MYKHCTAVAFLNIVLLGRIFNNKNWSPEKFTTYTYFQGRLLTVLQDLFIFKIQQVNIYTCKCKKGDIHANKLVCSTLSHSNLFNSCPKKRKRI